MHKTSQPAPALEFALELRVEIGPPLAVGSSSSGLRRTIPILGGTFAGPLIAGRVLPCGEDWQLIESDGLTHLDAHYVIETEDGVRIEVRNQGLRHGSPEVMSRIAAGEPVAPEEYYFRTAPRFHAPDGPYDWLRRSIFLGACERYSDLVVVHVWKVA